ncbi:hypothetical protein C4K22_2232 [Pseudomonas chlororaphis subsp. aurantiaca]|nr:hypothetical protein C4K22_2232 [Pseudomonas chlororaphis subsp. aurantiaca]AZD41310.1 hypothetical protein C4K21_2236 [Pseudomonas chlororaphis subsp. aurantiaca]
MARTLLRVRSKGVAFYLNSETSSPNTGHRNRYRQFKTEDYGREKSGWIQVGSTAGRELMAIKGEMALLEACETLFSSKKPHRYDRHGAIRGKPGKWEGEAFPYRMDMAISNSEGVRHSPPESRRIAKTTDWANDSTIAASNAGNHQSFPKCPRPKSELALVPASTFAPLQVRWAGRAAQLYKLLRQLSRTQF